jgi:lipopolysaccharide/colanic/teichoic acid biosynthesis glycosyltransferase
MELKACQGKHSLEAHGKDSWNLNKMKYTGLQLGHPEITLPFNQVQSDDIWLMCWNYLQRGIAAIALLLLSPVILVMFVGVKMSSRGPFLFTQERPGLSDNRFKIYKVRTMAPGSEMRTALGVTIQDPTVTRIGKILRALKLDELPQLWNIVRGDMALVGPRPIPVALDMELRLRIPGFEQRYQVRPGLTSIGQICVHDNALGQKLIDDWKLRFEGELHYLRNRCVRYDLILIAMTVLYVMRKAIRK